MRGPHPEKLVGASTEKPGDRADVLVRCVWPHCPRAHETRTVTWPLVGDEIALAGPMMCTACGHETIGVIPDDSWVEDAVSKE